MTTPKAYCEGYFHKFGEKFRPLLPTVGLPDTILTQQDVEIEVEQYAALLELASKKVDPLIGLRIGANFEPWQIGVVGRAAAATPSVKHMLLLLQKYLFVLSYTNTLRLEIGENTSMILYRFSADNIIGRRQDEELALAAFVNIIRLCADSDFRPNYVEFSHVQPPETKEYENIFKCAVGFNCGRTGFCVDNKHLSSRMVTADEKSRSELSSKLDEFLRSRGTIDEYLLANVRHLISLNLCHGDGSIAKVSEDLGMSQRTLQRRLEALQLSFSGLVTECRRKMADEYITYTNYSLTEVANLLGYGDLSAFSRAFRRWKGESPQSVRNKIGMRP